MAREWCVSDSRHGGGGGSGEQVGSLPGAVHHPWHEVAHFYIGPWKWVKTLSLGGKEQIHTYRPLPCAENFTWVSYVIFHQSCGRTKGIILHFAD